MKSNFKIIITTIFLMMFGIGFCKPVNSYAAGFTATQPEDLTLYVGDCKTVKLKAYYNGVKFDSDGLLEYETGNEEEGGTYVSGWVDAYWSTSNNIITFDDDEDGELSIDFDIKKVGKCKVTVDLYCDISIETYAGEFDEDYSGDVITKKSYHIKKTFNVTVKPYKTLHISGYLKSYNTRTNVFTVKIKNNSYKKIKIYSNGAKSYDKDYTKFDRKLKLADGKKYVVIKPNQTKTIKFKVVGKTTWWNVKDEEVHFKCKYRGKKYIIAVNTYAVLKWTGKKWKNITVDLSV